MRQSQSPQVSCDRFEELSVLAAGETPLSSADREALETHRRDCPECRHGERLFAALRHRPGSPAQEPLDDLAAQRFVNAILAEVDTAPADAGVTLPETLEETAAATAPGASDSAPRTASRAGKKLALWAALAAALLLALPLTLYRASRRSSNHGVGSAAHGPVEGAAYGKVLLRAGDVRGRGAPLEVGSTLPVASVIAVGDGLAALQLREAVTLRLERSTQVSLEPPDPHETAVRLIRGELVAAVTPGAPGARFAVQTPQGTVLVTGTHFGVRADDGTSHVEVLHGAVVVTAAGRAPVTVHSREQLRLGEREPTALPEARYARLHRRIESLALLAADRGARLHVTCRPVGARVLLDDTVLGQTPFAAVVRPGHWRLAVRAPHHEAVAELLRLEAGGEARRDFALRPSPSIGDPRTAAGDSSPIRQGAAGTPPRDTEASAGTPGGERRHRQPPRPTSSGPDEGWRMLLSQAQARRAARDWAGAAHAYRELLRRYPERPEAHTAQVSLGFVLFEHLGQPAAALAAFDRYLRGSGSGPLAREATWGRLRALKAMGRMAEERRALAEFLRRYPGSVYEDRIRSRLRELAATPPVPRR